MANIIFSHGGKGGSGKSVMAACVTDYCIANDRPVTLIEGDLETPDVALRFSDYVSYTKIDLSGAGEKDEAAHEFLNTIDAITGDGVETVVVNLPANASSMLDDIADVLVAFCEDYGHQCEVIYSLAEHQTATDGIRYSIEEGMLSMIDPKRVTVAFNSNLGDPSDWHYVQSGIRDEIGTSYNEIVVPRLTSPRLANKVFSTSEPYHQLLKKNNTALTGGEKILLDRRFLTPIYEILDNVLQPAPDAGQEVSEDG